MSAYDSPLGNINTDISSNPIHWMNPSKRDYTTQIIYDYTQLKIVPKQQITKTMATDGYVRVIFPSDSKSSTPHLFFSHSQTQVNRYFVSSITVLVQPEAKLVIENRAITNGPPLYIHIPLKTRTENTDPNSATCIDKLINNPSNDLLLNLNGLLGQTLAAFYEGQSILVTRKHIYIYTDLSQNNPLFQSATTPMDPHGTQFIPQTLYRLVDMQVAGNKPIPDENQMPTHNGQIIEGLAVSDTGTPLVPTDIDEENVQYECVPYDIDAEDIQYMQVPFFSKTSGQQISVNFLQGTVYLFYLAIILLVCVVSISSIYKGFTMDKYATLIANPIIHGKIVFLEIGTPCAFILGGLGLTLDAVLFQSSPTETGIGMLIMFLFFSILMCIFVIKFLNKDKAHLANQYSTFGGMMAIMLNGLFAKYCVMAVLILFIFYFFYFYSRPFSWMFLFHGPFFIIAVALSIYAIVFSSTELNTP